MTEGGIRRAESVTRARGAVLAALLLATPACIRGSETRIEEPRREGVSFVYGFLDMEEAPTGVEWVELERVAPRSEERFYAMRVDEGVFYAEYVDPGSYVLSGFGASAGMFTQRTIYNVSLQQSPFKLVIEKPGVYFVGSWKYRATDTGFFEAAKYDLEETAQPTPREVIERILPHAKGTVWEDYLRRFAGSLR